MPRLNLSMPSSPALAFSVDSVRTTSMTSQRDSFLISSSGTPVRPERSTTTTANREALVTVLAQDGLGVVERQPAQIGVGSGDDALRLRLELLLVDGRLVGHAHVPARTAEFNRQSVCESGQNKNKRRTKSPRRSRSDRPGPSAAAGTCFSWLGRRLASCSTAPPKCDAIEEVSGSPLSIGELG